jgi:hypothetical protein
MKQKWPYYYRLMPPYTPFPKLNLNLNTSRAEIAPYPFVIKLWRGTPQSQSLMCLCLGKEGVLKHTIDKENIFEHGFLSSQHNTNHYYIFFFLFASCPWTHVSMLIGNLENISHQFMNSSIWRTCMNNSISCQHS